MRITRQQYIKLGEEVKAQLPIVCADDFVATLRRADIYVEVEYPVNLGDEWVNTVHGYDYKVMKDDKGRLRLFNLDKNKWSSLNFDNPIVQPRPEL